MNDKIIKQVFPSMLVEIEKGNCPLCKEKINKEDFKDELSKMEFGISGLCQKCQDKIFN